MTQFARRVLLRAGQLVLHPFERRQEALRRQLVKRLDRLDERVERALVQAQQNAALLSGARQRRPSAATRGRALPRLASELPNPVPPAGGLDISHETVTLRACPCCGCAEFTRVAEYNRFLTSNRAPDACAARYDYSLCHRCGVVFARIRPVGERFRTLLERFEDTLGRQRKDAHVDVLGSRRLTSEETARVRETVGRGVFASAKAAGGQPAVPALLRDRLVASAHVEILSSLLTLSAPRVLELRPRFGAIGGALRRLFGGETFALPLFDTQQIIVREVYGTRADALLDYDHFAIPYEGAFDLVVANHMVTHAVRPAAMLATIRERLAPGGHLYLYNEPDEADFLDGGKSMFKTLNPFHLQTFDPASLSRALEAAGFRTVFSTHYQDNCVVLAEAAEPRAPEPASAKARARRLARYAAARDRSILMLPDTLRGHFRDEWEAVIARAFATGGVRLDDKGQLRLTARH